MFTQKLSWMFKTTLFIIVKNWKHLSCPLVIERLNQLVHPHHGYYSARRSWYIQPGWIPRKLCWMKKPIPKGDELPDYIYITFLNWPKDRNGEEVTGCLEWQAREGARGQRGGYKRATPGSSWRWSCSVSWLWWFTQEPTHV